MCSCGGGRCASPPPTAHCSKRAATRRAHTHGFPLHLSPLHPLPAKPSRETLSPALSSHRPSPPSPACSAPISASCRSIAHALHTPPSQRWADLKAARGVELRTTCTIHTNVTSTSVAVRGSMQWPRLVESPLLVFPVTQQGQRAAAYITVKNHASRPVWLQLVDHSDDFLSARVDAWPLNETLSEASTKLEVRWPHPCIVCPPSHLRSLSAPLPGSHCGCCPQSSPVGAQACEDRH